MQAYHSPFGSVLRRHPVMSEGELLQALLPDPCADLLYLDTAYSKYSHTNYAASGQDILAITEIVGQRQAQLRDVTAELASVESIMQHVRDVHQQLLDKRDQILASKEAHQGLISCIRRLPPEILAEIFVRCLPPEAHIEPDTKAAPLLLMSVSRGWRKVALGTPRLWCSLSVQPSSWIRQQGLFFYHHWLSRAKGCPLSLAVDARHSPRIPVWRYEVTESLQPYTSRSVRLHVTFDEATAPDLLLKDVPILEHLTLDGDLRTAKNITIVQRKPRLRSLTINAITLTSEVLSGFNPNWSNLTQLRVKLGRTPENDADLPIVLALLALCPHLEQFSFSPVYISRHDVPQMCALTHTRLQSLKVVVVYGVGSFLDSVILPDLRDLEIWDQDIIPSAWRQNEFKTFLMRSQCPIERLKIHSAQESITKADRQEYAALIPTLKHLDLCLAGMLHHDE